jgi:REP element-mobilizing transposase RayT
MAKLRRFNLENHCYHTISATRERLPVFADSESAEILIGALQFVRREKAFLLAYAVLPDHLHLVIAPKAPFTVSQVMQSVKGYASRAINLRQKRRLGPIWQPGFYDRAIRDEGHLADVIHYVHANPVEAGLAEYPEAYRLSSAHRGSQTDLEAWLGNGRG